MAFLLQSSLRISPPLPFLPLSGVSRDPLKMGVGSQLDQDQAALAAVTSSPASASKRWPGASAWPSWDLLDSPEDPFNIEREARLHRQAAGELGRGSRGQSHTWEGWWPLCRHWLNKYFAPGPSLTLALSAERTGGSGQLPVAVHLCSACSWGRWGDLWESGKEMILY